MAILEEDDPLWKRVLFNELVIAFVAAIAILWLAFTFATGRKAEEEPPRKPPPASNRPS